MNKNMSRVKFKEIDITDPFFNSLINDYPNFIEWFKQKGNLDAYVQFDNSGNIEGFLYLKMEREVIDDIEPIIRAKSILKIGTFKINPHGTRLGERFIKIAMDEAIKENADICYVTILPKHKVLIELVENYGFVKVAVKKNNNNIENVYIKDMKKVSGNIYKDYPLIKGRHTNKYLLSIYPKYHSVMFPDSILKNERREILADVSYTNSIHKIYVCRMGIDILKYGDIIVIYRTAPEGGSAEYGSVATSICVVEEVKKQDEFSSFGEFFKYANQYSVFDKEDLRHWYNKGGCKVVKFTYNIALKKRIVRKELINHIGLERHSYWGFLELTDEQFLNIIQEGGANESIIIN